MFNYISGYLFSNLQSESKIQDCLDSFGFFSFTHFHEMDLLKNYIVVALMVLWCALFHLYGSIIKGTLNLWKAL